MKGDLTMHLKCKSCGHPYDAHTRGEGEKLCRIVHGKKFDNETNSFREKHWCACEGYVGTLPTTRDNCPHEFTEYSRVCVHCTKVVQREKKLL